MSHDVSWKESWHNQQYSSKGFESCCSRWIWPNWGKFPVCHFVLARIFVSLLGSLFFWSWCLQGILIIIFAAPWMRNSSHPFGKRGPTSRDSRRFPLFFPWPCFYRVQPFFSWNLLDITVPHLSLVSIWTPSHSDVWYMDSSFWMFAAMLRISC